MAIGNRREPTPEISILSCACANKLKALKQNAIAALKLNRLIMLAFEKKFECTPLHVTFLCNSNAYLHILITLSMHRKNLTELRAALDAKAFSAVELAQAARADALISSGVAGPLTGIPIAHKDNFVTCHWKTTAASKILSQYISPF